MTSRFFKATKGSVSVHALLSVMVAGGLLSSVAVTAHAQTEEAAAHVADKTNDVIEVVVTSQKRRQRQIDVPVAVNVLSAETLEKRNIQTVQDLSFSVPGLILRYDGPGSSQIFLRGATNIRGSDALVSSYMDDTPVTLTGGFRQVDLRALDLDRVEVLKGPQGTLYGQGAMAGTVRFITRNPSLYTVDGFIRADISSIDEGDTNSKVSGAVSLPLIKGTLGLRLAGAYESGGGWIDQPGLGIKDGNNQDIYNLRAKLLWKPTDDFDMTFTATTYSMKSRFGLDYENPDRTRPVPVSPDYDLLPSRHDRSQILNVTANYKTGIGRLTSSTSFVELDRNYATTYIAGPKTTSAGIQNEGFDGISDRAQQFTQEIRLTSEGSGPWQYTIGAFYKDAQGNLDDKGVSYYAGGTYPFTYRKYDTSRSISAFADIGYKITDKLLIGAGIRSFKDDQTATDLAGTEQKATFDSIDPRVYVTYALTPKWNLYGNISKGFRSGGFNSAGLPAYDPEKLMNYELGTKGIVADGKVRFDIAAYYSKYDDALRTGQFFNFPAGYVSYTRNIGEMEIKGLEGTIDWRVTPALTLSANAAYIDGEVTKLNLGAGETTNFQVGDGLDYAPKFSSTIAADYSFNWATNVPGFVHVDYVYRDKTYATDNSILIPRTQSSDRINLLNARVGVTWSEITAELYVTNLTNENLLVDPYDAWQQSSRTKPRTVGVSLSRNF
ncbi:Pesticin receptor (plasmid) [Asticcacaulis sp. MM231]|uniref:TonB-dependent receptor n=1 Tax=Asticcacaulis sp. MM231 TaxID=3157666 RepID=UPI0032D5AC1C